MSSEQKRRHAVSDLLTLGVCAGVLGVAASAGAEIIGPGITVTATNANGTASYVVEVNDPFAEVLPNGDWRYVLDSPRTLVDTTTGNAIATLRGLQADVTVNPHVYISFDVVAMVADTTFTISSAVNSFPTIGAGVAMAGGTAGVSFADSDGLNGVSVTGLKAGGHLHTLYVNGLAPGSGTELVDIVQGPYSIGGGSSTDFENTGGIATGFAVSSISSQFRFRVSGGDSVSGTSSMTVIPTPGAAALLGLGVMTLGFRRWKR